MASATHANVTLSAAICLAWLAGLAPRRAPGPARFSGPTLLTVGEWEPRTPVGRAERIRAEMPQTRIVTLREPGLCVVQMKAAFLRGPSPLIDATGAEVPPMQAAAR